MKKEKESFFFLFFLFLLFLLSTHATHNNALENAGVIADARARDNQKEK